MNNCGRDTRTRLYCTYAACDKNTMGSPKSISKKTFWGRGETNEATLKDLLANSFCCEVCLDEGKGGALPFANG